MDRERAITFTDDERCGLKHMNDVPEVHRRVPFERETAASLAITSKKKCEHGVSQLHLSG
jgi:hypothetical protein